MIYISAQPDNSYFQWQVELYLYQFSKHGIKDQCYAVFGYEGDKPSDYIVNLAKKYNIFWYKDERTDKRYIPSIRPHILKKFFADHPALGKEVFYHDSDIFLVKLPPFSEMLQDDISYLSDTTFYISYNYIEDCSKRYKAIYPDLPDNNLFTIMCECVGISEDLVKQNQDNSGGAQYLLKNIDSTFWTNVETSSVKLFAVLKEYESKYPISHHIQSWTADMWAVLWEYWKLGFKTKIHKDLDFTWATDSRANYYKKNIFHLAGVTNTDKSIFFKGKYTNCNIFDLYKNNNSVFDYVSNDSITIEYVNVIKEFVGTKPVQTTLVIATEDVWSGVYEKDFNTLSFGNPIWRSTDKRFIIFWNSNCWIVTASQYESEISETCGGFISYSTLQPFLS